MRRADAAHDRAGIEVPLEETARGQADRHRRQHDADQPGQMQEALAQWVALEAETPPDAPWRALLASEIDRAARTLGLDPAKIPGRPAAGAS